MISQTDLHMLSLLADVLHGRKPTPIAEQDWPALIKEMHSQSVYALPAEYFRDLGLPAKDEENYLFSVIQNRQTFHSLMREQKRALSALEAAEIPAVVIKGASVALYYPHPEDRCMGDIDLLVLPKDFEKAYDTLVSAGYRAKETPDDFQRHIGMFSENNIEVELHNYFSSSDHAEQNALLDKMLFQAIPSRVSGSLCAYSTSMLPPQENGLVLLGHINQHLSDGIGLRQIIDWMCYVENVVDDEFWENGFAEKAEQIGMKRLAIVVTAMCQRYLGLQKDIHWCAYEPICDELMEYILRKGNFGRKIKTAKAKTVSVLKQIQNPIHGLAVAQSRGLKYWEAAQKHRWLRPFAWCHQIGHWAKSGIEYGVTAGLFGDASTSAKEEADLLKRLGVTRL